MGMLQRASLALEFSAFLSFRYHELPTIPLLILYDTPFSCIHNVSPNISCPFVMTPVFPAVLITASAPRP